ncbi:hypothetical protein LCGC14_1642980 [marine sediment metagenome]|uniref:Uncharacterized protein n=1 Tax=marine sediment metagenome TaxID=412755 RepID=A0A0F9HZU8_9ZZZZ
MATEILAVPEDCLAEVIAVIRSGLFQIHAHISDETREQLIRWCDGEEKYLTDISQE